MSLSDDAHSQSHGKAQAAVYSRQQAAAGLGPEAHEAKKSHTALRQPASLCEPEDWDAPGSLCFPILGEKVKELQPAAQENGLR